jgi:hypothetical protein
MVEIGPESRDARLATLMERAQTVFERSRRLVEESRKIRAEAEAKRLINSVQNRTDDANGASSEIEKAADYGAE